MSSTTETRNDVTPRPRQLSRRWKAAIAAVAGLALIVTPLSIAGATSPDSAPSTEQAAALQGEDQAVPEEQTSDPAAPQDPADPPADALSNDPAQGGTPQAPEQPEPPAIPEQTPAPRTLQEPMQDAEEFVDAPAGADRQMMQLDAGSHQFTGTVTREGGAPVQATDEVIVAAVDARSGARLSTAAVDAATGAYALTDVPAGEIIIEFYSNTESLIGEYYNDAPTQYYAERFTLADEPQSIADINAELAVASQISGTVSIAGGLSPAGTQVTAHPTGTSRWGHSATVGLDGSYTIKGLAVDTYVIEFRAEDGTPIMSEYYDGVFDRNLATPVEVAAQDVTVSGIDAHLTVGSTVSGEVSVTGGGSVDLSALHVSVQPRAEQGHYRNAQVNGDGTFEVTGVSPGVYSVHVSGAAESNIIGAYVGGSDWDTAQIFTIAEGDPVEVTGLSASLVLGSQISGTVTREDGTPWNADLPPQVHLEADTWSFGTNADADGNYTIHAVPDGTYRLKFSGHSLDSGTGYKWYENAITPEQAQTIDFSGAQSLTGYDGTIGTATSLSGTVTKSNGDTWYENDLQLELLAPVGEYNYVTVAFAQPRPDGSFVFDQVVSGDYLLRAQGWESVRSAFYPGVDFQGDAEILTVGAEPVTLQPFGLTSSTTISGTVTRADDAPIQPYTVAVYAYDQNYRSLNATWVGSNGEYRITGVTPGEARLQFSPQNGSDLTMQWWGNSPEFYSAPPIAVSEDLTPVTGIDAVLEVGATISGTVTGPDGTPLQGVWVSTEGWGYSSATTAEDGTYELRGVGAAHTLVRFSHWGEGLIDEYWQNAHDRSSATTLDIVAGSSVTGIDAQLERGGTITGSVEILSEISFDQCAISVNLTRVTPPAQSGAEGSSGGGGGNCLEEDGTFAIDSIAPGNYTLSVSGVGLATQWYNSNGNVDSLEQAETLVFEVDPSQTLEGLHFELTAGASIQGTVSRTDGGSLNHVKLEALNSAQEVVRWSWSSAWMEGGFNLWNLPLDTYVIRASAAGVPTTYYGGDTFETATAVELGSDGLEGLAIELGAATPAELSVTAGGGETVTEGQSLQTHIVHVADSTGAAALGAEVDFSLSGPAEFASGGMTARATSNAAGLAVAPAIVTNAEGQVTVTATLVSDTSATVGFAETTVRSAEVGAGSITVVASAVASVVDGKITVIVTARNDGPDAVALVTRGALGTARVETLEAGAEIAQTFTTARPTLSAGVMTITVSDASDHSTEYVVSYEGITR